MWQAPTARSSREKSTSSGGDGTDQARRSLGKGGQGYAGRAHGHPQHAQQDSRTSVDQRGSVDQQLHSTAAGGVPSGTSGSGVALLMPEAVDAASTAPVAVKVCHASGSGCADVVGGSRAVWKTR
jgi:hypothetical protein